MNLTNEIIGGLLLILLFGVTFLIRYAFIERNVIRHTQMRLSKIEEEVQKHPLTCPLKQQIEQQAEQQSLSDPESPHSSQTACFQSRLTTAEVEVNFRTLHHCIPMLYTAFAPYPRGLPASMSCSVCSSS